MENDRRDNLLTADEVAARLRLHIGTVYELLRTKRLKGFQIRRRWRIRQSSLDDFMSERELKDFFASYTDKE